MIDDSIAAPGLAHRAMAPELDLLADLMGGTTAMRRAGLPWLAAVAASCADLDGVQYGRAAPCRVPADARRDRCT